jgi:16S rRNA processing protein RimM
MADAPATTGRADPTAMVLMGTVGAPHGVRGEVRLKSYTADPLAIGDYGPLSTRDGRHFEVLGARPAKEVVIARLSGVNDRNAAEALKGLDLFVPRAVLPPTGDDEEFYHADLIGLRVETEDGRLVGHLVAVHDFGAGDILDIRRPTGPNITLGFTRANVPVIDLSGRRMVVVLPAIVEAKGGE